MSFKKYFSYVRVSTQRQGQVGTSLTEQLSAIENYARRFNLNIIRQFEERETAAKTGRPVFLEMLKALKQNKAHGIIIHKIDRSARNLKDWAELGTLIDLGIEVHFANESLDLNSRGGRLSADIQAVVASDYIRNLREETKKGIYGRLKQGLYPFPARVGYLDKGAGNAKEIDPLQAPLVKKAFELYSNGNIGLDALVEKMYELGLRNKNNRKISRNGLVCILKNPFYMGLIKIDATNELFIGQHKSLISKELFETVQDVFNGKNHKKKIKHFFIFRKHLDCKSCQNVLIPEKQKSYIYYRCQTKNCPQKTIREEIIEDELLKTYQKLTFNQTETELMQQEVEKYKKTQPPRAESMKNQLQMNLEQTTIRLNKLADAYVDEVFDKETYLSKKNQIILEKQQIKQQLQRMTANPSEIINQVEEFLELLNKAYLSYKLGEPEEKRYLVKITTSNFEIKEKSVVIKLKKEFQIIANRPRFPIGSPTLAASRTFRNLLYRLISNFSTLEKPCEN
jgi:DNA invertase Pin-like site-specific DNA recombinase